MSSARPHPLFTISRVVMVMVIGEGDGAHKC